MEVTVRTPARLHFGIIDMSGDLGRIYCSVGVAIDRPNIVLRAKPAEKITASGSRAERVKEYAEKILEGLSQGAQLEVLRDIPEHVGFGSGTQLTLATGSALSRLFSLGLTTEEIAEKLQRGQRSGVGTYAFKTGGFIVDGGHATEHPEGIPLLIFKADVPEDWLFVVGLPSLSQRISGERENEAFRQVPRPPSEAVGKAARAVLVQMLPSIMERDIKVFGEAMTMLDSTFGESWATVQGGKYSHPLVGAGINRLLDEGAYGVGQSSWGPAFYGLVEGEAEAERVSQSLQEFLDENGGGEAFYAKANNHGAEITVRR
jgi:beta-RFAP synthase